MPQAVTEPADGSIDAFLRQALSRAGSQGLGGDHAGRLRGAEDGLRFVQRAVAGTLLGRRLVFLFDGVARLRCDAAGRRLLGYCEIDPDGADTGWRRFDEPDAAGTGDGLAALVRAIALPANSADLIALRCAPLPEVAETVQAGVSMARLQRAFGLEEARPAPDARLRAFLDATQGAIHAAALLEGNTVCPLCGDDAEAESLARCAETVLPRLDGWPGGIGGPLSEWGVLFLTPEDGSGTDILLANCGGAHLLARTDSGKQAGLLRIWHALFPA
jgi:hypothetical protein